MGLTGVCLTFVLLLTFQWAVGLQGHPCQSPGLKCDFVCDCSDCSDEESCGYRGRRDFVCDFEDEGLCGWRDDSPDPGYTWERRQRGDTLPASGPSSDYTTGTASGWFVGVSAVKSDSAKTAVLTSPVMKQSAPTCRLRLRYFTWDSGHTGLGSMPLWASVSRRDSREAVVWRPASTTVNSWREASVFLGRISTDFQIQLYSRRTSGRRGDVAIDHLEFLDCALPLPTPGEGCAGEMLECKRGGCVAQRQVCDGTDDCGDGTDEQDCGEYRGCDFEQDLCDWDLRSFSRLKWTRTSQNNISTTDPLRGPGRDHSNNSASGHFLYVTEPEGELENDWASFQSPLLDPTNSTHPCKMVMYSHQFGPRSGGLVVLIADRAINAVWARAGALGDLWVKAEVDIVADSPFYIIVMAAIRSAEYGGVAVDSMQLSAECRLSNGSQSLEVPPTPPGHPCTTPNEMCNFIADCKDAEDEAMCGDFLYDQGSSGWTDTSIGSQSWTLNKMYNSTTKDEYLYVTEAPGQQLTEAQTRTPLLGPSGPACSLSFSYALTGRPDHIGQLSVRVIDSMLGSLPKLWEFSGKTGTEETVWRTAEVHVGDRKHRFQLALEARAKKLYPSAEIKVKDVHFHKCHADYFPFSPTALSCNFEDSLCGWYQDHSDNFDWTLHSGMDHTIGIGKSLVVDLWSPSLRGLSGRLLSFPQSPFSQDRCLSFFYKLYGSDTGILNVKVTDKRGFETLLWTRSGAHGNEWHEAQCSVPHQLTRFQLMFEVLRSGFDGRVAVDDVALLERSCTVPRMCSFEGQRCGYSSSGTIRWLHRNGHTAAAGGPKTDHTLETETGYYMMVHSGVEVLPAQAHSTLTSPLRRGIRQTQCVSFWYHMGGRNPGFFTVYMKPVKGQRVEIFSNHLNQGDVWRHGNANITSNLVDWQLEFEVVGAGGGNTHVAIDDVVLSAHPCQSKGSKCNLERGLCGWSNTNNSTRDKLNWDITSREAETHYDVPSYDHTLGTERGHFLFFPSSSRTSPNQNAQLLSIHLPPTKGTCLKFWAYRPSSADSQLKVLRLSENKLQELLVVEEIGATWQQFRVGIDSTQSYQIVFEGIKGTAGTLALDDIEYTIGVNCDGKVTDPLTTSRKRDNAGGIAASVLVLLLLLGTLAALLVYYLKTQERDKAIGQAASSPEATSFDNDIYNPKVTDHVTVPPAQNHPMAAGFNNVLFSDSAHAREMEVA